MKALFYPHPPVVFENHTTISKVIRYFKNMGYKLTNDIESNWVIGIYWNYDDINKTPEKLLKDKRPVVNRRVNNVTKSYVDYVFTSIFGYSSMVDTNRFGYCVQKSEKQSAHDGKIIRMPCQKESGYIYQKLIDNRLSMDMVYDIRIPVFMEEIPFVFIKSKTIEGTFENMIASKLKYWIADTREYLTNDEIIKIKTFACKMHVDIAEIDGLRDNSTGRLYLTDVNNLPGAGLYNYIDNPKELERQSTEIFKTQLKKYGWI